MIRQGVDTFVGIEPIITMYHFDLPYCLEKNYLDSQMKRIPFIAQMKALDFERYKVQYRQDGRLEAGMPVIDGRDQEALPGNSETVMQIDYKFLQDGLFLPDDSG